MNIFYSRERRPPRSDMTFQNPRFFEETGGINAKAKLVVLDGAYPEIEEAYKAAGITVEQFDARKHGQAPAPEKQKTA